MYDDGYNRKKSKKRKKKQSGDKEKKPKIETKSKKEANKFNIQGVVKLEMKDETHISSDFDYLTPENIEEIPVPQGSYNDKIIIEDDPVDSLKIIGNPPEIIEKCAKKKKKHSKHSEQKKLKPKHVSKSKRKRDLPFLNHIPTSNMYNINSNIQRDIIPRDYNLMPVSVALSNELNKKATNKTNTNPLINPASNDDRKDTAKPSVNIAESRPPICSSTNDRSDFSKIACTNTNFGKNSYALDINFDYQNETSRHIAATQIKQLTNINYKNMGAMSPENKSMKNNIRNDLIKAPRFVFQPTIKSQTENYTENQQIPTVSKNHTNDVIDTKNGKNIYLYLPPFQKPPVLKNEMEAQYTGNNNAVKSPPSLENSMQFPADARVPNLDCTSTFFNSRSQLFNRNTNFKSGVRTMGKMPCTSDDSDEFGRTIWTPNTYLNSPKLVPEAAISEQELIQIPTLANASIPKNPIIPQCSSHFPPSFMPINNYVQNDLSSVINVLSPSSSKQTMPKITKSASRQRSQKGTSRRKPSAKSNKSNNNASSNTSQGNIMSTSVGTQIDSPIESSWNRSNPNIESRITNIQNASHEDKHSNIPDNKAQLQDLQKQRDNICSRSLVSKSKMPSILRKKPKEKKATTRRKQPIILPSPLVPVPSVPAIITSGNVAPAAIVSPIVTPFNIVPVTATAMTVAPATTAPLTIAPATITTAIVQPAPATAVPTIAVPTAAPTVVPVTVTSATPVAPVIEAKDQSMSTQFVDMPQLCSQSTPIIPGHISEMIYPNIPNSELLKAFNNYWSAQVSHCAICATFASCTSGSSRMMPPDWKYCESTTLPESTPIWVRKIVLSNLTFQ